MATRATGNPQVLIFFINFLFELTQNSAREIPHHCKDIFNLLCNLIRYAISNKVQIQKYEQLLESELDWLREVKVND